MIRAVIFDCFGVLASDGWLPYRAKYFGDNPALLAEATDVNKAVDAGLIDYDTFIQRVAELADLPEETARQQIENNIPDEQLFAQIKALKPKYRIGLLSNAGDNWLAEIFTPEQVAMFDAVALSYETGKLKPQAEAYQTIAARLGVPPEECIFTDDQPGYVDGAMQAGMKALLYGDAEQFARDLAALLRAD